MFKELVSDNLDKISAVYIKAIKAQRNIERQEKDIFHYNLSNTVLSTYEEIESESDYNIYKTRSKLYVYTTKKADLVKSIIWISDNEALVRTEKSEFSLCIDKTRVIIEKNSFKENYEAGETWICLAYEPKNKKHRCRL